MRWAVLFSFALLWSCAEAGPGGESSGPGGGEVDASAVQPADARPGSPPADASRADARLANPDAATAPSADAAPTCGAPGQACCSLFQCNPGATCNGVTCDACGQEGGICCGLINQTCFGALQCVDGSCVTNAPDVADAGP